MGADSRALLAAQLRRAADDVDADLGDLLAKAAYELDSPATVHVVIADGRPLGVFRRADTAAVVAGGRAGATVEAVDLDG